jgi:hypothetical protein
MVDEGKKKFGAFVDDTPPKGGGGKGAINGCYIWKNLYIK